MSSEILERNIRFTEEVEEIEIYNEDVEKENLADVINDKPSEGRSCLKFVRELFDKCRGKSDSRAHEVRYSLSSPEGPLAAAIARRKRAERILLRKLTQARRKSGVPFAGHLPVAIEKGRLIEVAGRIHPTAVRFSVNLACGTGPLCDLAFHFNPRFDQNIIVRCYRRNGRWGEEECAAPARNPLQRGTEFIIVIFATDKEFMVAINGKHYCSYAFRLDVLLVQTIEVHGDVTLDYIDYRMGDVYPEKIPNMPEEDVLTEEGILDTIATPYLCTLSEQFTVGKCIEIVGRVKRLPHSFYVNLQNGIHLWPHPTIPLHINPRFKSGSQYTVVLNSWVHQKWGAEEHGLMLFTPGRPFVLSIICCIDHYRITLDGVRLGMYRFHTSPDLVNALFIQGDVIIKSLRMR